MNRIRSGAGKRRQPRIGAPDPALVRGLAAITGLCDRLGVISALMRRSARSSSGNAALGALELLTGIAAAQLAWEDFWWGWIASAPMWPGSRSRRRPDCPRPRQRPWPAGSPPGQWRTVETGLAAVTGRMWRCCPRRGPGVGHR